MEWLGSEGYAVFVPVTHSRDVDLIGVDPQGTVVRVQVKTSTFARNGRWEVAICTRGGNQSWSGMVKRFAPERCDLLFVLVGDGRRWCIPADRVEGANGITLGGLKYAAFEIEPGRPLAAPAGGDSLS
jgi:hypothetical protein